MPRRQDEVIQRSASLLIELGVRRCPSCGSFEVWSGISRPPGAFHWRCGGRWFDVLDPSERALVLHFLSKEMFTTPRRR